MLTVRHLEFVRELARHRHFGRAAEALRISQPALTRGLHHIEDSLGVELFDRADPISPTIYGQIVLQRGEWLVEGFGELLQEIALTRDLKTGSLSVTCGPYPAEISALEAVGKLSKDHPTIACRLMVKGWLETAADVIEERSDLAVVDISDVGAFSELDAELLRNSRLSLFCRPGHPLAGLPSIAPDRVFDYPWVIASLPNRLMPFVARSPRRFAYYDAEKQRIWPRLRAETFAGVLRVVEHSDGISGAPLFVIADEIADGRVVVLPIDLPWLTLNYGFVWRRGRSFSPAAAAFMARVREIEARLGN